VDDYAIVHPFNYAVESRADLAPFRQAVYPSDQETVNRGPDGLALLRHTEIHALPDRVNRGIADRFHYQMREEPSK
jgi:hypothetical protein